MMACLVIQQFMARDPENQKFSLLSISATPYWIYIWINAALIYKIYYKEEN